MTWKTLVGQMLEDYSCLALMGICVGIISWIVDKGIYVLDNSRNWLFAEITDVPIWQYFGWVSISVAVLLFSAAFLVIVEPKAAGSGIPEMKTILRGVEMKGYLTWRMLVAKVVGIIATLGSGMPLGKEGPFVHIGAIVAQLLNNIFNAFKDDYDQARNSDMLAAGTAVGIAACFAAPVGGMLFSIEVTSTYFAVRHYWKRYFAALWGAIMFRLLAVWTTKDVTLKPLFATSFSEDIPYNPYELFFFALMGVFCGLMGALFVWMHRKYMRFVKYHPMAKKFFGMNRFIYPGMWAFVIATITFPLGFGHYIASEVTTHHQMTDMFNNITWSKANLSVTEAEILHHWVPEGTNVFANLFCYSSFHFIFSMIAYTLPVPCGAFVPSLKIGSGFGRLFGEILYQIFPNGIVYDGIASAIVPGGYALVGAAAFSAALTRSIAVAVILLEVTGQLTHLIPILLAVLVAYSVVSMLQPSLYDSIIMLKDLPYLPDLRPSATGMYSIYVENFTNKNVVFIWNRITYGEVKDIMQDYKGIRSIPLVDSATNMILLGSVDRSELIKALDKQVGPLRRIEVAQKMRLEEEQLRLKEEKQFLRVSRNQKRRRSSSVGVLPAPDVTSGGADTPTKVFTFRRSFKGLSRHHSTNSSRDSRFRSTLSSIFGRNHNEDPLDLEIGSTILSTSDPNLNRGLPSKRVKFIKSRVDLTTSERRTWEFEQLREPVNFLDIIVNPSPVQLVEKTPLSDVHSLFSMVGINQAYVTNIGRLVGVVGLTELKGAIEDVNSGNIEKYCQREIVSIEEPCSETPLLTRLDRIQNSIENHKEHPSSRNSSDGEEVDKSDFGTMV